MSGVVGRIWLALPMLVLGVGACSSTTIQVPSLPSADPADTAKVEAYCTKVQKLVDQAARLRATPNPALASKVSQQAKALAEEAVGLVAAAASDPVLAARVSQCSQQAASAAEGG